MNSVTALVGLDELDLEAVASGKQPATRGNSSGKSGSAADLNPQPLPPGRLAR